VSTPDITFEVLGRTEAAEHVDELQALHGEVYAAPPYGADGDAARFADRFRVRVLHGLALLRDEHAYEVVDPRRQIVAGWRMSVLRSRITSRSGDMKAI